MNFWIGYFPSIWVVWLAVYYYRMIQSPLWTRMTLILFNQFRYNPNWKRRCCAESALFLTCQNKSFKIL
jgi:hypothetical protein